MFRKYGCTFIVSLFIVLSFAIKLVLIFKYKNLLTLGSDDLNYIKSAAILIRKGIFTFHNFNEPTVFVTPIYPFFLAAIFKLLGYGLQGLQAVRIIQALFSCVTIWVIYLTAKSLFNAHVALISSFLVSFYIPNITTVGYMMTETLFTTLLCVLIYLSLKFSRSPSRLNFLILGFMWGITTLCRPTVALYPLLLFAYMFLHLKVKFLKSLELGIVMLAAFCIIMSPWWVRNYIEYGEFIPLAASSGNPMLQGTYVNYSPAPSEIVYYKLGKNALETDKTEVKVAKERIGSEFKKDFWGYLRWFTLGKTYILWNTIFYWKEFFSIDQKYVLASHYIFLLGFAGAFVLLFNKFFKYMLPISVVIYFNAVHCVYMAFDRYAFPLLPLLSIYSGFFIFKLFGILNESLPIYAKKSTPHSPDT